MSIHRQGRSSVPLWVRSLSSDDLHALAGKLRRDFLDGDISDRQDWLLDRCFSELEYRSRIPQLWPTCHCDLCAPPGAYGDWIELELPLESDGPF